MSKHQPLFALGHLVMTPDAEAAITPARRAACLFRHAIGDFGSICAEDAAANREAIASGGRVLSAYTIDPAKPSTGFGDNTVWLITEADRSASTFFLSTENIDRAGWRLSYRLHRLHQNDRSPAPCSTLHLRVQLDHQLDEARLIRVNPGAT
jgi:hypothetical protein